MNRAALDAFVEHHRLRRPAVETLLELTAARPSRGEELRFATQILLIGGALCMAAGVIFFVAANWDELRVIGRFALLEALFVANMAAALWRPPPNAVGRFALLGAFMASGALLALFGQTYQTGANTYELFLGWALLGLPLIVAGRWSGLWAAWLVVLNTALALFCASQPIGGLLWILFSNLGAPTSVLLMIAAAANLGLWATCEATRGTSLERAVSQQVPLWLRRLLISCALGFGTWASVHVTLLQPAHGDGRQLADIVAFALHIAALAAIGAHAMRRRQDVFPLALIVASLIILGTFLIGRALRPADSATYLAITSWLVLSSTAAGHLLMKRVRDWRIEATPA